MRVLLCQLILNIVSSYQLICQSELQGIVYERHSGLPASYSHVFLSSNPSIGTITNEDGKFRLFTNEILLDTIEISHVGFHPVIKVTADLHKLDTIWLEQQTTLLSEITVLEKSAKTIIGEVIDNLSKNHGLAGMNFDFYTRVAKLDERQDKNHALYEIAGKIRIRSRRMSFALSGIRVHYNDLSKLRFTSILKLNYDNPTMWVWSFLKRNKVNQFTFYYQGEAIIRERSCYLIEFKVDGDFEYYNSGVIYIDKSTLGILRLTVKRDNKILHSVDYVKFKDKFIPLKSIDMHSNLGHTELLTLYRPIELVSSRSLQYSQYLSAEKISKYEKLGEKAVLKFCQEFNCPTIPQKYYKK